MKTTGLTLFAVMGLLILGSSMVTSTVFAGENQTDVAAVVEHVGPDPDMVFGTSVLMRTDEGVAFTLDTTMLVPGNPHSLWIFIDETSATAPAPNPALVPFEIRLRVDGAFSASDGSAGFSGFLPVGAIPAADGMSVLAADDGSFDDPQDASILFLVRDHGQLIPGMGFEQTHYVGGCGTGGCTTVQEAFHMGAGALTLDILLDRINRNPVFPPSDGGAFHIAGMIYPAGTLAGDPCPDPPGVDPIGTYNCWGFSPKAGGGPGLVNQEFNLFDRGKILCTGQEGPTATLAVVGGTGYFANARGAATRRDQSTCTEGPNPPPPLTVRFTVDFDMGH